VQHAVVPGGVIGRDDEVTAGWSAVATSPGGVRAVAFVGEPGVGKSTVWAELCWRMQGSGWPVRSYRATESERRLSYCGAADVLTPIYDETADALPAHLREAVEVVLLRRPSGARGVDARLVGAGVLAMLRRAAGFGQLAIAIDDAHWLDDASSRVLAFALRRLGDADDVRLMLTARAREQAPLLDAIDREGLLTTVPVGPLDEGAIRSMLAADETRRLSARLTRRISTDSGGNALLAKELARAHVDDHASGSPRSTPVPVRLGELLGARIDALSPKARGTVLVVALAVRPSADLLGLVFGSAATERTLREARKAEVLVTDRDGALRFSHPLLASVVDQRASPARRRAIHARLAEVTPLEEARVRHRALALAEPDNDVAQLVEDAAREAVERGALAVAADLAELSIESTPPEAEADRRRRLVLFSERLFDIGDGAEAELVARDVISAAPRGVDRARALLLLGRTTFLSDRLQESTALLEDALVDAAQDPRLVAEIRSELSGSNVLDTGARLEHAAAAVSLYDGLADHRGLSRALLAQATVRRSRGEPSDLRVFDRVRALDAGVPSCAVDLVDFELALSLVHLQRFDDARTAMANVMRFATERGEDAILSELHAQMVRIEWLAGCWDEAADHARACMRAAIRADQPPVLGHIIVVFPLAPRDPGHPELDTVLDDVRVHAEADDASLASLASFALGLLALTRGEYSEAADRFDRMAAIADRFGERGPGYFEGHHVDALLRTGRVAQARDALARLAHQADVGRHAWSRAVLGRCRGQVLAAERSLPAARAELASAVQLSQALGMPFEHALTLLARGEAERRAQQKRVAGAALMAARDGFDALGAHPWAARAQDLLDRLGGRRRSGALTEGELRVARLAAQGRTNAEIAGELFISIHTVESNLTRIYRTLGVRSRTQLARSLTDEQT
jgi:DNA-binding CsgD family transcriptional regulator/tetratricopeptide (TPR) repeat protein